jgi:hypothetical protein
MVSSIPEGRSVPKSILGFYFPRLLQHRIYNLNAPEGEKKTSIKPPTYKEIVNYLKRLKLCGFQRLGFKMKMLQFDKKFESFAGFVGSVELFPKNNVIDTLKIIIMVSPRIFDVTDKTEENRKEMIDDVENDRKIRLDLKLLFADWLNYIIYNYI